MNLIINFNVIKLHNFIFLNNNLIVFQFSSIFIKINYFNNLFSHSFNFWNFYIKIWFRYKNVFNKLPCKFIYKNKNYFYFCNFLQKQNLISHYNYFFISSTNYLISKNNMNFLSKSFNNYQNFLVNSTFFLINYIFIKNIFSFFNLYNLFSLIYTLKSLLLNKLIKPSSSKYFFKYLFSFSIRFKKTFNLVNLNSYLI